MCHPGFQANPGIPEERIISRWKQNHRGLHYLTGSHQIGQGMARFRCKLCSNALSSLQAHEGMQFIHVYTTLSRNCLDLIWFDRVISCVECGMACNKMCTMTWVQLCLCDKLKCWGPLTQKPKPTQNAKNEGYGYLRLQPHSMETTWGASTRRAKPLVVGDVWDAVAAHLISPSHHLTISPSQTNLRLSLPEPLGTCHLTAMLSAVSPPHQELMQWPRVTATA